jgi:2-C-methyl-D-erythritol 4-phosphate cytidylyltransferase
MTNPRSVAVILAGGTGRRLGLAAPKQLSEIAGRSILEHAIAAFDTSPRIDEITVVMAAGYLAEASRIAAPFGKVTTVCEGGTTRTESTLVALERLADLPDDVRVLFHDAARPFVDHRIIADCVETLDAYEVVAVAMPSSDTVVMVRGGLVVEMPAREDVRRFQTPQGFHLGTIRAAYELALRDPGFAERPATDDCGVVHRYLPATPIRVVQGSEQNLKVTHPIDLVVAESFTACADDPGSRD